MSNIKRKYYFTEIFITQCICIFLILAVIFTTKYLFKSEYKKIENFYKKYISINTDIKEVTETDSTEI